MINQDPILIQSLRGQNSEIRCGQISPDNQQAVSGSIDGQIFVWNFKANARPVRFIDHKGYIATTIFSKDGKWIASGGEDKQIRIWKNSANIKFSKIAGHSAPIRSLCFSKNEDLILSASNDKSVRIYQTKNKQNFVKSFLGHKNWVTCAEFSPDNSKIVSGSDDMSIRIWDTESQKSQVLLDHQCPITSVKFLSETFMSSSDQKGKIKIWDIRNGMCVQHYEAHDGPVSQISNHIDGVKLLSAGKKDSLIKMWDLRLGKLDLTIQGHSSGVNTINFSQDGDYFITGGLDRIVMIWKSNVEQTLDSNKMTLETVQSQNLQTQNINENTQQDQNLGGTSRFNQLSQVSFQLTESANNNNSNQFQQSQQNQFQQSQQNQFQQSQQNQFQQSQQNTFSQKNDSEVQAQQFLIQNMTKISESLEAINKNIGKLDSRLSNTENFIQTYQQYQEQENNIFKESEQN